MKDVNKYEFEIDYIDKNIWWTWFLSNKQYWGSNLTYVKLKRLEQCIFNDKYIWDDLLKRHDMKNKFPFIEKEINKDIYKHAIGNFAGMIYEKSIKLGMIKV